MARVGFIPICCARAQVCRVIASHAHLEPGSERRNCRNSRKFHAIRRVGVDRISRATVGVSSERQLMITVKVRKGYQLTIPAALRKKLEIAVGDKLHFTLRGDGILVSPCTSDNASGNGNGPLGPIRVQVDPTNGSNARSDRRPRYQREEFEPLEELIVQYLD